MARGAGRPGRDRSAAVLPDRAGAEGAKNRWHLDVEVTDRSQSLAEKEATIAAEVASLIALGATELETIHEGGGTFTVLHDPEGDEFCVQ